MFQNGSVTENIGLGAVQAQAIDLANLMNDYLLFANQIYPSVPHRLWREIVDGTLKALHRPLNWANQGVSCPSSFMEFYCRMLPSSCAGLNQSVTMRAFD